MSERRPHAVHDKNAPYVAQLPAGLRHAAGAELYRNAVVKHAFDPAITPHYLRHTYCTNLRRQGVDLKTAQYLMGHADISTTANIYSHVTEEDVRGL